jgi:hypothetical protein
VLIEEKEKEKTEARAANEAEGDNCSLKSSGPIIPKWVPKDQYQAREEPERKRKKKQTGQQKMMDEWDDLAAEETAYRKFKKGKMSKKEYEKCLKSNIEIDSDTGEAVLPGAPISGVKKGHAMTAGEGDEDDSGDNDSLFGGSDGGGEHGEVDGGVDSRNASDQPEDSGEENETDSGSDGDEDKDDKNSDDNDDSDDDDQSNHESAYSYTSLKKHSSSVSDKKKAYKSSAKGPFQKSRSNNLQAADNSRSKVDYRRKNMKFGNGGGGSRTNISKMMSNAASKRSGGSGGRSGGRGGGSRGGRGGRSGGR